MEDVVHHGLERGRRVSQAEEHDSRFKEAFTSFEGHLPFVPLFDLDVVIPPVDIKLGEQLSSSQVVDKF